MRPTCAQSASPILENPDICGRKGGEQQIDRLFPYQRQ
jgi:hypothetical protein